MLRTLFSGVLMLLLAGCASGGGGGPTPTTLPFTSDVTVTYPQAGSVIYAESVRVQGQVNGDAAQTLQIELIDADGNLYGNSVLNASSGDWSVELPHTFQGIPAPVDLVVRPVEETREYARVPLTFADVSHRPTGSFASILFPAEGDALGGDTILVEGAASGYDALTVSLVDFSGATIDEQPVDLSYAFLIDEIPWQVELSPQETIGVAEIHVSNDLGDVLQTVSIRLDLAAG